MRYRGRIMQSKSHVITGVEPGSIAEEMGLRPGDRLLAVNGHEIEDIFDYRYLISDDYIEVLVQTDDGEELLEIEKDYSEDLGLDFGESLMDAYRHCSNKCIFCFIDQLPKGMRDTLYFKDDDSRLSFLQGNYITMTNMSDEELDRIILYKLEPINISVHTTNPELRQKMLSNRFAGRILEQIRRLYDGGIIMNAQIVLCRGWNDGEELERTIRDLTQFMPNIESLSVVPVGLSDHREGLCPLEPFTAEDAGRVIDTIERWQKSLYAQCGTHFVHASDEWYLLAGRPVPEEARYDGYLQLENGVGMIRLLITEFTQALDALPGDDRQREVSIATGMLAESTLQALTAKLREKFPGVQVHIHAVENRFFGSKITVSGLLTGRDIIEQLSGERLGEELLLPANLLRAGETVLLDDMDIRDIESALQIPVRIVQSNGQDLVHCLINRNRGDIQ